MLAGIGVESSSRFLPFNKFGNQIRKVIIPTRSFSQKQNLKQDLDHLDEEVASNPPNEQSNFVAQQPAKQYFKRDLISPPHPVSNLRLYQFAEEPGESEAEKQYRLKRIEVQDWNHNYWLENNLSFQKQKAAFIKKLNANAEKISHDELAQFYKQFLDENHIKHRTYNWEWYKRQVGLLLPAAAAFFAKKQRQLRKVSFWSKIS